MSTSERSFFLKGCSLPWLLASFLLPRCCDLNGTSMPLAQTGHSRSSRPRSISVLLSTDSLLGPPQESLTLDFSVAFRLFLHYSIEIRYLSLMLPSRAMSVLKLYVFHYLTYNKDSTQTNNNKIDSKSLRDQLRTVNW